MECALQYIKPFSSLQDTLEQFRRLEQHGFTPFLLYTWRIQKVHWGDEAFLSKWGLKGVKHHPVTGKEVTLDEHVTLMWRIVDWELFLVKACPRGCNLFFNKQ